MSRFLPRLVLINFLLTLFLNADAQYIQQLRGTVVDQVLQQPLAGATVSIPILGKQSISDTNGVFRFQQIPVGVYKLVISYTGFKEATVDNIIVNAGKATVLTIPMEAWVKVEQEFVVRANSRKNKPLNEMSTVSARAFSVDETQRYAAAVNDPLRMATAFPGVLAADDGNNAIIIRGNSPAGLLWRMEGLDIPNPNHFSTPGSSGGGISILSSQLLSNSDFVTAAFAAEYGNALSGVFDLHLRKGNNEKREYSFQAGVLGLNAAVEGPFSKKYKGSYLINYRYSTLELLNKAGVLPDNAGTNFSDLSYNIYLPTSKLGNFSLFGFTGWSGQIFKAKMDSTKWEESSDRHPFDFLSNTRMNGMTHSISLGNKATLKTAIGQSFTRTKYLEQYVESNYSITDNYKDQLDNSKFTANTMLQYKLSNQLNFRAGIIMNWISYNYKTSFREHKNDPLIEWINNKGNTATQQAYMQWQYKPSNRIVFNAGLHYLRLSLNKSYAVEPRFSARYTINAKQNISLGYGSHSQIQTLGVYFAKVPDGNGDTTLANKNLGFTKARHYVLSHQIRLSKQLLLKTEFYYQQLTNVPVSTKDSSTFSTLNLMGDFVTEPLKNEGKGANYGVEISLERYLQDNFYLTLSNSFYQSKYTAYDKVERNTRFNGNYIITFIAGKEYVSKRKSRTFGINIKTIYAGGLRTTPIDLAASRQNGYTVFKDLEAYSLQNEPYFRTDLRFSLKWNRLHHTSTLSLDFQNVTNRLNVFNQWYDDEEQKIVTQYQTGLIPVLNYKIEF
ncbi:MAG: TonB-dependent receptor [Chitinophagaceae bacterium]|nr:TonB-dependent receptor [Chitinophagaceae bacterium]